jgi:hypothetical protein
LFGKGGGGTGYGCLGLGIFFLGLCLNQLIVSPIQKIVQNLPKALVI